MEFRHLFQLRNSHNSDWQKTKYNCPSQQIKSLRNIRFDTLENMDNKTAGNFSKKY